MTKRAEEIVDDLCIDELQMSFFIHLWVEGGQRRAWRGRINDGHGGHSLAFEDEQALLGFIRTQLRRESVVLPWRRIDG